MDRLDVSVPRRVSRRIPAHVAAAYLALFLVLDWASFIRPLHGLNITPWNPQPALAIALLLWNPRWLWLVWVGLFSAELVVRGVPADWAVTLMATAALSLVYAATARALAQRLDPSLALANRIDLLWFTGISVGGALLAGVVYVTTISVAGQGPSGSLLAGIGGYWIGDAVGLIVMLPLLLALIDAQRRSVLTAVMKHVHWHGIALLIVALLWIVFGRDDHEQFKLVYLLLLPVVWAAAKFGLPGAVLAASLTQIGLIAAVQTIQNKDLTVFELQALLTVIAMTGLWLGVAVDERERAAAELRGSLRMVAAGQMAAALAHELSQPLTALSSYAQACRLLLTAQAPLTPAQLETLANVSRQMVDDAQRASDVIKRLRDFFRSGTTQLRHVRPVDFLADGLAAHERRAEALHLKLELKVDRELPELWLDPVQMGVVLRNLLANALDAASQVAEGGQVDVTAQLEGGFLRIDVSDNGAGVDPARLATLFEPGSSDKPGAMGVGLSICRAIVEAHGGRLWLKSGKGGCFCFTIPLDRDDEREMPDAR